MSGARAGARVSHRDQLPSSSRYELLVKIASGGMATVYVGRLSSAVGITRLVAVKRAHAHLLEDPSFAKMLVAEARLASQIHHPNVVAVHNVEEIEGELLLVMDYVEGASLSDLLDAGDREEGVDEGGGAGPPLPARIAARILLDACAGLQAAHELADEDGRPLGIVHRDVSPHNILVGVDGVARLTDFGIAKSSGGHGQSTARTSTGALKGKVSYMAPEYVEAGLLDARSDVFSLGIVAWEALTRRRLFRGATEVESLRLVLACEVPRPSAVCGWLGSALDGVITKALARSPADRFASAAELAEAFESAARRDDLLAKASDVAAWVKTVANDALTERRALVRERSAPPLTPEPEPRGRDERTASIAGPAPAVAHEPRSADPTFGSGVSAQLVEEARGPTSASRPRLGRPFLVGIAALALALMAAVFLFARRPRTVPESPSPLLAQASTAPPPASPSASMVEPSAPLSPPPRATTPSPPPAPSAPAPDATASLAVRRPAARPPAKRAGSPPAPIATATLAVPVMPTETPADRAPPNPYGR